MENKGLLPPDNMELIKCFAPAIPQGEALHLILASTTIGIEEKILKTIALRSKKLKTEHEIDIIW